MPIKLDTRKKTLKQKEKNKRRKKRNQSRKKRQSKLEGNTFKIIRSLNQTSGSGRPNGGGARSRSRRPSMQSIHGVVANAYASRMPIGSNHTKDIYANTQRGLSTKDFFKRTLRDMRRAQNPDQTSLPPTYSYQNRQPIYPASIQVQPIGLAEPSKSLVDALKALPAASMPRGHRQSLLRQAIALPIATGLAEPGMPDWGQMYEATEEGRAQVTRAMTADELRKEDNYMQVQADMRTGGPGPSMGIWAPSRVRTPEDGSPHGSMSSRESARRTGRRKLSMAEEHAFLQYYPHQRTDMLAAAKIPGPEGQTARAQIRQMINAVFSNSNSSKNAESHASSDSSLSEGARATIARMANLTQEEIERLTQLEMGHLIPGPDIQGYDRWYAVSEAREVLQQFNSPSNPNSASSIHTQESIHTQDSVDDPLHLSAGEIFLLRRQGPEGVEYIRRATTSANQEVVMDQVAEARAFLSTALMRGARSRSGSRNRSGSRSRSGSRTSTQSALNAYQRLHDAAFLAEASESSESSGSGPLESMSPLSSIGSRTSSSTGSRSSSSTGSRSS